MSSTFCSGFCSIIGPPNAGKSTLLNAILKYPLNIVSNKPQTTRNNVLGIYNEPNLQIIFTDTPGILKQKKSLLDQEISKTIDRALHDTHVVLFLVDISSNWEIYKPFVDNLVIKNYNVILVFNKIDLYPKLKEPLNCDYPHILISAEEKTNIPALLDMIKPYLTDSVEYYPLDMLSNRTERFFVKEYIRESILEHLHQEIPHSTFVDVDEMDESDPNITRIKSTIYCEREAHKKIVIGNKGTMIKTIGTQARQKIEALLDKRVFLELSVKVFPKWKDNSQFLKKLEYY